MWCGTTSLGYLVWFDPCQEKSESLRFRPWRKSSQQFSDVLAGCGKKVFVCATITFSIAWNWSPRWRQISKSNRNNSRKQNRKTSADHQQYSKKQERGNFEFKTDNENDVLVCKWNDNSVVNLCSNASGVYPRPRLLDIHLLRRSV